MEVFTRINGVLSALLCLSFAYQIIYLLAALLVLSVEPEDAALIVLPPPPQPLRMPVTSMAADRRTAKVFFFIIQYLSCFVNLRFIMC